MTNTSFNLNIQSLVKEAKIAINTTKDISNLNFIRIKFLGKKSVLKQMMLELHGLTSHTRPIFGAILNKAKLDIEKELFKRKKFLDDMILQNKIAKEKIDITLPGRRTSVGRLHPITYVIRNIEDFFNQLGFFIVNSMEIEDEYYNFDALNIPKYHPVRKEQDTFWIDQKKLLRTQTSGIQIRTINHYPPPIRVISSGKVYRKDYDKNHTPMFHQIEGFVIDKGISFANLKGILYDFLHFFFKKNLKIRFRPSYFPFTEPSAEIDIKTEHGSWLEILGCGMIHPTIMSNANIDTSVFSGFAFGMGIERLIMLRYGINDVRLLFENHLDFLRQFKS